MAETLKIQIEMVGGDSESSVAQGTAGITGGQAKDNVKAFAALQRGLSVAKQFSMQITNGVVGQIGLRSGNYVLQERVQTGLNVAQKLIGIGVSFAVNPVLGTLNLVSEGIGMAFEISARNREIMWQNRSASELARRAGYLSNQNR